MSFVQCCRGARARFVSHPRDGNVGPRILSFLGFRVEQVWRYVPFVLTLGRLLQSSEFVSLV